MCPAVLTKLGSCFWLLHKWMGGWELLHSYLCSKYILEIKLHFYFILIIILCFFGIMKYFTIAPQQTLLVNKIIYLVI